MNSENGRVLLSLSEIRPARKQLGVGLQELAARIGTDKAHLSKIERGLSNPSWRIMSRIAKELGFEGVATVEETARPTPAEGAGGPWPSSELREEIRMLRAALAHERRQTKQLRRALHRMQGEITRLVGYPRDPDAIKPEDLFDELRAQAKEFVGYDR